MRLFGNRLGRRGTGCLGVEAIADAEVGVDVAPARRALLQLLAQLADEDVDRAVAVGHRVAPDPLVDRLALEHLALGVGKQLQQLELATGQVKAAIADEGLELVGADLQLAGDEGTGLGIGAAAATAAGDGLDPRHHLLRVAGLADPVVDPEPQAPHPLGNGRASGANDHAEVGKHPADPLQVGPRFVAENGEVDQQRVQLHRHQLLRRDRAAHHPLLPARRFGALRQHGHEAAVVVDYREPDGLLCVQVLGAVVGEREPLLRDGRIVCALRRRTRHPETPAFTGFSQLRRELPAFSGTFGTSGIGQFRVGFSGCSP